MGLCIQSWLQLTKPSPGQRQLHPASTCTCSHPPSSVKEVSPCNTRLHHANMLQMLKYPCTGVQPLSLTPSTPCFQLQTLRWLTLWGNSDQVCTHIAHLTVQHSCRPTSTPHLALTHAMLHVSIIYKSILHTHAVTSNLSPLAYVRGLILLFRYPLLGGDRREIFFLILFSLHCRP